MLGRDTIAQEYWRCRIATYAERISGGRWKPYKHLVHTLDLIQRRIMQGGARIIINQPPRHGKSVSTSHYLPTWFLDWFPDRRVILASYGGGFAATWGSKVRDEFVFNPLTWTQPKNVKASVYDWLTVNGGGMMCCGAGGAVTGRGGDLLIVDDPHKSWEEAMSPTYRNKVIDWFNATFYTRAEPGASIIINQTRWHEMDLSGYLLHEHSDEWTDVIRLPAFAEADDPLGREEGEPLCPERYDTDALNKVRRASGEHVFAGLYQQRPSPIEGGIIKRAWVHHWQELPPMNQVLIACDLTFGSTDGSYVALHVWGQAGPNFYLMEYIHQRMDFPSTLRAIEGLKARYPEAAVLIERAANGAAAADILGDKVSGVLTVPPKGSKEARLMAVATLFEAGNVYLPPRGLNGTDELVEELVTFPNSAHDDHVDAASLALGRLRGGSSVIDIDLGDALMRESPWRM